MPTQTELPSVSTRPADRIEPTTAQRLRAGGPHMPEPGPVEPGPAADPPLEQGFGKPRGRQGQGPVERIALSERAESAAEPAAAGKSNFIAAARRAGFAAASNHPATIEPVARRKVASAARQLTGRTRRLRKVIAVPAAAVLLLGSLAVASMLIHSGEWWAFVSQSSPDGFAPTPAAVVTAAAPAAVRESAAPEQLKPPSASAAGRQMSVSASVEADPTLTSGSIVHETRPAAMLPSAVEGSHGGEGRTQGSHPAASDPATAVPPTARAAASLPAGKPLPAVFGPRLRAAAARGDADAQYEVALRYFEGRDLPQDLAAAADWIERSANQGLAPAQFRLGSLYEKGLGVPKDLNAARRFYLAAAQAGHAKAQHNLAVLYAEGVDGKPDYHAAASWFRKAAGYGVVDSQYNLGVLYDRGIGVEQNPSESYKWFAVAARAGDLEAAKKRDSVAARLDPQALQAASQAAQAWTPQLQPQAAVQVWTPRRGWDDIPGPEAASTQR
jgi:localization factor PodJL